MTTPASLNHDLASLEAAITQSRNDLFIWGTSAHLGASTDYDEVGSRIIARLNALSHLKLSLENDALTKARDADHLLNHHKEGEPVPDWELELMGFVKKESILFSVTCYDCDYNEHAPTPGAAQILGKTHEDDAESHTTTIDW